MNWRLGLTPAADRNASVCMAGSHYAAMATARCIAFRSPDGGSTNSSSGGGKFRPLKAPQSKSVEGKRRDTWETLRASLVDSSGPRFKDVVVGGLQSSVLDRFPGELKIMGPRFPGKFTYALYKYFKRSQLSA